MNLFQKVKFSIIKNQIEKRKKNRPFDFEYAEKYEIPEGATNHPNNSYYFSLHDLTGKSILFRLAKRGDRDELWLVYHDVDGKSYRNRDPLANNESKASVKCLKVGEEWQFQFNGPVIEVNSENKTPIQASLNATFTSTAPIFEFSRHSDSGATAKALAKEKLSKAFLKELSENHQVHYEQAGKASGTLQLDDKNISFDMRAMRDHSFGKRDWNYMDRHIWLMALLENGEVMNVNMVRYPAIFEMQHGYYEKDGKYINVFSCTEMDKITLSDKTPDSFTCEIKLVDGRNMKMICEKEIEVAFPFDNGAYTIFEGIGKLSVDGIKGRGIIEIGYNGDKNRWTR
ncbi:MAG: hypothetical protein LBP67_00410 [Bacteroidales bacterium]|jgi:hypothetical protein|nr:hypothetical protein [Bacteroidales bacterium]